MSIETTGPNLVLRAMLFAQEVHAEQVRKYTDTPYAVHLAEVAALTHAFGGDDVAVAAAWLHDSIEDQGVTREEITAKFGLEVAQTVWDLSDMEVGNRATRKELAAQRLARSDARVQTVKLADLISNTKDIAKFDPNFARVYLKEKEALLSVLEKGNRQAHAIASELVRTNLAALSAKKVAPPSF